MKFSKRKKHNTVEAFAACFCAQAICSCSAGCSCDCKATGMYSSTQSSIFDSTNQIIRNGVWYKNNPAATAYQ